MSDLDTEALFAFPCEFPIKVMGRQQPGFARTMVALVREHCPDFDESSLQTRLSRENTYLSLTFTVRATSREHLDDLYRVLCDHPMVSMVL